MRAAVQLPSSPPSTRQLERADVIERGHAGPRSTEPITPTLSSAHSAHRCHAYGSSRRSWPDGRGGPISTRAARIASSACGRSRCPRGRRSSRGRWSPGRSPGSSAVLPAVRAAELVGLERHRLRRAGLVGDDERRPCRRRRVAGETWTPSAWIAAVSVTGGGGRSSFSRSRRRRSPRGRRRRRSRTSRRTDRER